MPKMNTHVSSEHETKDLCPRCCCMMLKHVHCRGGACSFFITVCSGCDSQSAVEAFMRDHAKDHLDTMPYQRVELSAVA